MVIPFGLVNAFNIFQKYINWAFRDCFDEFCSSYVDDILIYIDGSRAEHQEQVIFFYLRETGLQLNVNKCEFEMKTTKYFGFIIEMDKNIIMDPAKIETIIKWEVLKTVKRVQRFLGVVSFYRKFIKNFSQLVMPLANWIIKNTKFEWSRTTNETFSKLKQILVIAPLLIQFDNTRETVLETNVSIWCIGGILSQYMDGIFRPFVDYLKKKTRRSNAITKFTIQKC